jgi:D-xylose 1-dehydrogenase
MTVYANYPSLKGRGVFITGGASGIGASLVTHFCEQGSRVAFVDIAQTAGHALVSQLTAQGLVPPLFFPCDLTDISALQTTINQAAEALGGLHVLINNAGNDERHAFDKVTVTEWDRIMSLNLRHQFFAAQAAKPWLMRNSGGAIVNLGSICHVHAKTKNYPAYMTAKSAVVGLTRALALELGEYNIRANCLMPGWVMTERQIEKWLTKEAEIELLQIQALKRKLYPADIARMALFLAADDSQLCTQQTFIVDGGWV